MSMLSNYKPVFIASIVVVLLSGCSSLRTTPLPLATAEAIGFTELELRDPTRKGRRTTCRVWYPSQPHNVDAQEAFYVLRDIGIAEIGIASGVARRDVPLLKGKKLPIIVFSHGQGGSTHESIPLAEMLASRGFIFVAVLHTGDTYEDEYMDRGGVFKYSEIDRPTDIEFVIDQLTKLNQQDGLLSQRIDFDRLGVMGHSFGGYTSLAVVTDHVLQSDPRIKAVMPVVPTFRYFEDEEIGSVQVPVFMLGGEDDLNTPVEQHIDRAFSILEGSTSFLGAAVISKANHYHFTNIDQIGDAIREVGIGRPFWPLIGGERLEREYALATDPETISPRRVKEIEALYALAFFSKFLNDDHRWDLVFDPRYASLFLPEVAFRIR